MDYDELRTELMDFLREGPDPSSFDELALTIFNFQFACNKGYRAYCGALEVAPESITRWQEIPALPCDAFKLFPPPFCGDSSGAERCFLSSGTTGESRSRHYFRELDTYQAAIRTGWREGGLPPLTRTAFVSRPPGSQPESSLMFMFETLAGDSISPPHWLLDGDGSPSYPHFGEEPLILFGTSLNLLDYFSQAPLQFALPSETWVFQTGGFKGLQREISPTQILDLLTGAGVAAERIINEYGMTELSSQAYAIGAGSAHKCPPWMRVQVINPETGLAQDHGVEGYLEVVDLANLGSALAVRTQDIAVAVNDREFVLQGRDAGALPRGCSRSPEAALTTP